MSDNRKNDLVIVGTGLAGTVTLVHELLKIADDPRITAATPVNITLLERYPQQKFGGVAYGKTAEFDKFHLNLSSKRATPFMANDIPEGFPTFPEYIVELADASGDAAERATMLRNLEDPPRQLFSRYLSHLADLAIAKAGGKANVTTVIGEAIDLDVTGAHPKLTVKNGDELHTLEAGQVVLATGQREIQRPEFVKDIVLSPLYLEDIYSSGAKTFYDGLIADQTRREDGGDTTGNILVLGTGLSADDAVLRLLQSGYKGKITMISRNGLEHAGYGATSVEEYLKGSLVGEPRPDKMAELANIEPRFMRIVRAQDAAIRDGKSLDAVEKDVVTAMRREFSSYVGHGYTPEEILGTWERYISDMGDALPDSVCQSIYDRYATWLGTHRVGTTPENTRIIEEAKKSGQLEIVAGYISTQDSEKMREENGRIIATIAPMQRVIRAGENTGGSIPRNWDSEFKAEMHKEARQFDYVLSGLGNAVTYEKSRDPFWASMIAKGLVMPHKKSGDGIELDPDDLTIIDANGQRVENVAACGIPAFGATMYGRFPHPEKPGVRGGRILPFTANIVGVTGGIIAMVPGLHDRLMLDREGAPGLKQGLSLAFSQGGQEIAGEVPAAAILAQSSAGNITPQPV